jgi:ubiquinone/menaquinone biosynthesis C-methylase UbiE
MSRQHRHYFNNIAAAWPAPSQEEPELILGLERFIIGSGEWILDLGTGKGRLAAALRRMMGSSGQIVALDYAEKMLQSGLERLSAERAMPLCCDAAHLACKADCFDKVICMGSWPHFDQPVDVIREVIRVLRPGGQFLIWHTCCSRKLNAFHAQLNGIVAHDVLLRSGELAEELARAGFVSILHEETPQRYWVQACKPAADQFN